LYHNQTFGIINKGGQKRSSRWRKKKPGTGRGKETFFVLLSRCMRVETEIIACLANLALEMCSAVDHARRQNLILFQRNETVLAIQHAWGHIDNS